MSDYDAIEPLLDEHGIPLVEDAAEALGSHRNSRMAGSRGRAAALSFNGNKIMTTSGGGMLLTTDESLAQRARKLSTQAREDTPWYEHTEIGYNYRLSNILAALGRAQLTRLEEMIKTRRNHRRRYEERLPEGVALLTSLSHTDGDNCWLTCIRLSAPVAAEAVAYLNSRNIEARHLWKPLHKQRHLQNYPIYENGVATQLFDHGLALPSGSALRTQDIETVLTHLHGFIRERREHLGGGS